MSSGSAAISSTLVISFSSAATVYHLNLAKYGTNNGASSVDADTLYVGSTTASGDAATITFANSGGVYQGYTSQSWAPGSTNSGQTGGVAYDYFATGGSSGTVTIAFTTAQAYVGFYWGSMSDGNTVTFTLATGAKIVASYSSGRLTETWFAKGATTGIPLGTSAITEQNNEYFALNDASDPIKKVVFSGSSFEFSDVTYSASTVTLGSGDSATQISVYDPTKQTYLCFLAGTRIATPAGEVPVETLQAGDLVLTASGAAKPVRWAGRTTVSSRFADPLRAFPVRIAADALDENLPARDLLVSPDHALLIDGVLVQAGALVNGLSVTREHAMPASFVYHHLELATHEALLAEGAPAESFVDNVSRMAFDNWETHPDDAPVAEMNLPRALSARQVPAAIRARLARRIRVETAA